MPTTTFATLTESYILHSGDGSGYHFTIYSTMQHSLGPSIPIPELACPSPFKNPPFWCLSLFSLLSPHHYPPLSFPSPPHSSPLLFPSLFCLHTFLLPTDAVPPPPSLLRCCCWNCLRSHCRGRHCCLDAAFYEHHEDIGQTLGERTGQGGVRDRMPRRLPTYHINT